MSKVRPIYLYICLTLIILAGVAFLAFKPLTAAAENDPAEGGIMPLAVDNSFSGGDGSEEYPYLISSEKDLRQLADNVNNGKEDYYGTHFKLTDNITLHGEWTPISCYYNTNFMGIFDGGDNKIEGLLITPDNPNIDDYCGLFGSVWYGTIRNLTVEGDINTTALDTGGIVGTTDSAEIINCSYEGTIRSSGSNTVGGIVGSACSGMEIGTKIINCRNKGNITGSDDSKIYVGGITGYASGDDDGADEIINCKNEGSVSANGNDEIYAGGIAGWTISTVTITDCHNTGSISAQYAGGIVGFADVVTGNNPDWADFSHCVTTITNCLNENEVQNSSFWGEFVGKVSNEDDTDLIIIRNCYYKSDSEAVGSEEAVGIGEADIDNVEAKSTEQFNSGEVAWLLQNGRSDLAWGQQLTGSKNSSPILTNDFDFKVLKVIFFIDDDTTYTGYANPNGEAEFMPEAPEREDYLFYKWTDDGKITGTELSDATAAGQDIRVYPTWQQPAIEGTVTAEVTESTVTVTSPAGDDYEYSLDGSDEWQTDPKFDGLTPGSEHTVYVRRRSTAGNIAPSESRDIEVTVDKAEQQKPEDVRIEVTDSKITVIPPEDDGEYEYALDNENWQDNPEFDGLTPGSTHTVHVRKKGTDTQKPSESTDIAVTIDKSEQEAPEDVEVTVSDGKITVTSPVGNDYEYSLDGSDEWQNSPEFGGLTPGSTHTVRVRRKETETQKPSESKDIVVTIGKAEQEGPEDVLVEVTDSKITVTSPVGDGEYEYSLDGGEWQDSPEFDGLTPGSAHTVRVRRKGTEDSEPSGITEIQVTLDKAAQETPESIGVEVSDGKITVTSPVGNDYEYALDNGEWQDDPEFDGLTPGSSHTVHVRRKETDTHKPSGSKDIEVTIDKASQEAPEDVQIEVSDGKITVTSPVGNDYEYALDDGEWQDSPEFDGLTPGSTHVVHVRRKGTDTHKPSESTNVTVAIEQQNGESGDSGSSDDETPSTGGSTPPTGGSTLPTGGNTPPASGRPSTGGDTIQAGGGTSDSSDDSATNTDTIVRNSDELLDAVNAADNDDTVKAAFNTDSVTIGKEVFEAAAKKGVTLEIQLKDIYWTIDGKDIEKSREVDLGASKKNKAIPQSEINAVAGDDPYVPLSLEHDGDLGFKGILNIPIDSYDGKYANLYYYTNGKLELLGHSKISAGYMRFAFRHASDYLIVIGDEPYGEDISFDIGSYNSEDVSSAAGSYQANELINDIASENKAYVTVMIVPIGMILAFIINKRLRAGR